MFGVEYWYLDVVFPEKVEQSLLTLNLRQCADIPTPPEQIESVVNKPTLSTRGELCLQFRKVCASVVSTTTSPSMMASPDMANAPASHNQGT